MRDVDVTLEGDAIALADFLTEHSRNFRVMERYPEFGTAKVQYKDSLSFDFASTRRETYAHCGAMPMVVERGVPLMNDVIRRDFTVNTLAFSIHDLGQVLDYVNGLDDIQKRVLRVLHPVSFFEDPSRILRALKFCARFDLTLSPETERLMALPAIRPDGVQRRRRTHQAGVETVFQRRRIPSQARLGRMLPEKRCVSADQHGEPPGWQYGLACRKRPDAVCADVGTACGDSEPIAGGGGR